MCDGSGAVFATDRLANPPARSPDELLGEAVERRLAGEIGHWRLSDEGPVGFGKQGSVEGWLSGPGASGRPPGPGLCLAGRPPRTGRQP